MPSRTGSWNCDQQSMGWSAITRTSALMVRELPSRSNSPSWITHTRELERIKLELASGNLEEDAPMIGSLSDGMHQAIHIATAMRDMKAYLT
ncbi:MAG: hypothetical protein V1793_15840 [Pseudomonadota bacterium]